MSDTVYFRYTDGNGTPYYYGANLHDVTYEMPVNATIYDPTTMEQLWPKAAPEPQPEPEPQPQVQVQVQQAAPQVQQVQEVQVQQIQEVQVQPAVSPAQVEPEPEPWVPPVYGPIEPWPEVRPIEGEDLLAIELPPECADKTVKELVQKHFNNPKIKGLNFTDKLLRSPLLKVPKYAGRGALDAFRYILGFTHASSAVKSSKGDLPRLIELIRDCPKLKDEVYAQLIMQTRGSENEAVQVRTWGLFIIIATLFAPENERGLDLFLKAHIHHCMEKTKSPKLLDFAHFCYIRLSARAALETDVEKLPEDIVKIPSAVANGLGYFTKSIEEQMWHQRKTHPTLPIPHILQLMANRIISGGGERIIGIFRISADAREVERIVTGLNRGEDNILETADIIAVSICFKRWFGDLPERLIGKRQVAKLEETFNGTKDYIGFVNSLPRVHMRTMMFLIGFIKRMVKAEPVTSMGPKNMGIVFAPNLVDTGDLTDPMVFAKRSEMTQELVCKLIEQWDTSSMFLN